MISNIKLRIPVSDSDHSQGHRNAPLVLLEYGDYECPFCGKSYFVIKRLQETLKQDLRFVFRNFPLSIAHPHAMDAARIAEAAGMQGKFWEMHDLLYENQDDLELESLFEYAAELNLDLEKLDQDMKSEKGEEKIARDIYGGARSGVNGTPTFFINGFRYDGDYGYQSLLTALTAVRRELPEYRLKKVG